jgi:hypothetical protein
LRKAGLDIEKDVEWVRCGVGTHLIVDALKTGKVECAPITSVLVDSLKKEGCNVLVVPKDSYPNGRPERIIAATGKILEERPDLVKSFLKGLIRSYWFVRDMPKNFEYLYNLDKRLRLTTPDPEERLHHASRYTPLGLERMPFPIDGLATGFEDMLREEALIDGLNFEVPAIEEVCAQDLVTEAYKELRGRKELDAEYQRVRAVADRCGY